MTGLAPRQREVLEYIAAAIRRTGLPPTIREIGRDLGIGSTNGVSAHLRALERKGCLLREQLKSRAMRLTHKGLKALGASPAEQLVAEYAAQGGDLAELAQVAWSRGRAQRAERQAQARAEAAP